MPNMYQFNQKIEELKGTIFKKAHHSTVLYSFERYSCSLAESKKEKIVNPAASANKEGGKIKRKKAD